ncbi:MAG: sulfatase-like hydrolase/transferase [Rikenellaceae bacterium]
MNKFLYIAIPLTMAVTVAKSQEQRANILWITTDDQRADALECWNRAMSGSSQSALGYVSSPNIDKLAAEGVLFTHSYCNSPLSGPSRASMHTGQYPHHTGMFNFQLKHNEHDNAQPIIPEVMREAGYSTAAFGKLGYYIYQYSEPMTFRYPESHYEQMVSERDIEKSAIADFSYPQVTKEATYEKIEQWHYPNGETISLELYRDDKDDNDENRAKKREFYEQHEVILSPRNPTAMALGGQSPMPTEFTEDGRILDVFSEYINNPNSEYTSIAGKKMRGADTSMPQFINLGFHFPHTPVMPSKEYRDKFKDKKYIIPEFDEAEREKMPEQMKRWQTNFSFSDFSEEEQQQMIQDYYAFCAMGDQLIGEAVAEFKNYCEKNNQPYLIVYTCGDHGWHLGEQGAYFKWTGYLKSNETAVVVVSSDKDKYPAGKVVHDYVEYVDFAPTFYATAGYDLNEERFDFLDGRDLYVTCNSLEEPREYVLGEVNVYGNRAFLRSQDFAFSMRSRKGWNNPSLEDLPNSNVKWPLEAPAEEVEMGLYDLRVDPYERNNVAYNDDYKELAAWFRTKLGNIVLGDRRFEAVWDKKNLYNISDFAVGSDDKKLDIPQSIIPAIK